MPVKQNKRRRWQFSLRTVLIAMAALPVVAGIFYGTFGEPTRQQAVRTLVQLSRVLLPIANVAILILFAIGVVAVAKRLWSG